jgi:capsular polysaccharide biosynthesis protein
MSELTPSTQQLPPPAPSQLSQIDRDDEIDLRPILEALLRWWREIVLIAFVFALLAGLAILALRLLPPSYEASADVAIVRVQSDVTFDERFTTKSDEQQSTTNNTGARRGALIGLAMSPSIAQKVIEQLGDQLKPEQRDAQQLLEAVAVSSNVGGANRNADSDLIRITVEADSSEKAAQMATTWAQIFVQEANTVYGQTPDALIVSIEVEEVSARELYLTAQAALEEFTTANRADELQRQISLNEAVVTKLQQGEQAMVSNFVDQVVGARTQLASAYLQTNAENEVLLFAESNRGQVNLLRTYARAQYDAQQQVVQEQVEHQTQMLRNAYATEQRLQKTLASTQALRRQVAAGSETLEGGSLLALRLLKLQAFSDVLERTPQPLPTVEPAVNNLPRANPPPPAQPMPVQVQVDGSPLQLQLSAEGSLSKSAALAEIDALLATLTEQLQVVNTQIEDLSARQLSGDGYRYLQNEASPESALAQAIDEQNSVVKALAANPPAASVVGSGLISNSQVSNLLNLRELQEISDLSARENSALKGLISQLEEDLRNLKSQLEAQRARQQQLAQERDLAWSTFTTVSNKVAELKLAKAAAGSEVRFAGSAVPPLDPVEGPSLLLAVVGGGFIGGIVALFYVLIANFLGKAPFLSRQPAQA